VSGTLRVKPGQVLYVDVGGVGGLPTGGFNGGGDGGSLEGLTVWGGGGASDVRLLPSSDPGSLASRLIVAGGGGGSAYPAAAGGDAGASGGSSPGDSVGGGAGTQTAGGAGGCDEPNKVGCGADGSRGEGGAGGASGTGATAREGAGGGGGLWGGGGGAGDSDGGVGGGGGGSSLVPSNGSLTLAPLGTDPSVLITAVHLGAFNVPINGTSSGTATLDLSTGAGTTDVAGQLSHLGTFTASTTYQFTATGFSPPLVPYELTGSTTFVAATGDDLFATFTGTGTTNLDTGVAQGTNLFTFTGGTGRFANASGALTESYTSTGTVSGTTDTGPITIPIMQGEISYGGNPPPASARDRPTRTAHHRHHRHHRHKRSPHRT
jgi:hypothetical protein